MYVPTVTKEEVTCCVPTTVSYYMNLCGRLSNSPSIMFSINFDCSHLGTINRLLKWYS